MFHVGPHAGLDPDPLAHYPTRLQRSSEELGDPEFRRYLHKIYYTDLCEAILKRTNQWLNGGDDIVPELRRVAA